MKLQFEGSCSRLGFSPVTKRAAARGAELPPGGACPANAGARCPGAPRGARTPGPAPSRAAEFGDLRDWAGPARQPCCLRGRKLAGSGGQGPRWPLRLGVGSGAEVLVLLGMPSGPRAKPRQPQAGPGARWLHCPLGELSRARRRQLSRPVSVWPLGNRCIIGIPGKEKRFP